MLAKRYRLPAHLISNFQGTKYSCPNLLVIAAPSTLTHDRIATIISKKVYLKAHDRNALKRTLHAALTSYVDTLPHFDFLIIAHPSQTSIAPQSYAADLVSLIRQIKPVN